MVFSRILAVIFVRQNLSNCSRVFLFKHDIYQPHRSQSTTDPFLCHDTDQMRLLLIRHGETEHNVAGLLAGVTDSLLTNHGLLQAQRLGAHLVRQRCLRFSQVFASDLKRAFRTADEICQLQNAEQPASEICPIQLPILREQDFGSFELHSWNQRKDPIASSDPDFKPKETAVAMKVRADAFLDDSLLPLMALDDESEQFVAVVSHGIFLGVLWRALLLRLGPLTVSADPAIKPLMARKSVEHLPSWSNTGCLELSLQKISKITQNDTSEENDVDCQAAQVINAKMRILAVNNKAHLTNLKRTRGGLGSSTSDDKQKRVDSFFKKLKVAGDSTSFKVSPSPASPTVLHDATQFHTDLF